MCSAPQPQQTSSGTAYATGGNGFFAGIMNNAYAKMIARQGGSATVGVTPGVIGSSPSFQQRTQAIAPH